MKGYYNVNNINKKNVYNNMNETKEVYSDFDLEKKVYADTMYDAKRKYAYNNEKTDNTSKIMVLTFMTIMAMIIVGVVFIVIFKSTTSADDKSEVSSVEDVVINEEIPNQGEDSLLDKTVSGGEEKTDTTPKEEQDEKEETKNDDNTDSSDVGNGTEENVVSEEEKVKEKVKELSQRDTRVAQIYRNFSRYPLNLMKDIVRNNEMIDFTVGYLEGINKNYDENIDISSAINDGTYKIPLLIQWDTRWGYYKYGNSTIGISGCGPTALNMVYIALTGDASYNPLKMAKFSTDNGYCVPGVGTSWSLMIEGAAKLGLSSSRLSNDKTLIKESLEQGKYIIASMGPGVFTEKGHFIVISGYENGKFRINDPFCIEHSKKSWSYSEFGNQVKALWVLERGL